MKDNQVLKSSFAPITRFKCFICKYSRSMPVLSVHNVKWQVEREGLRYIRVRVRYPALLATLRQSVIVPPQRGYRSTYLPVPVPVLVYSATGVGMSNDKNALPLSIKKLSNASILTLLPHKMMMLQDVDVNCTGSSRLAKIPIF